jgi:hypothetical protein
LTNNEGRNVQHYGHLRHPETGEVIATIEDGKITENNGEIYRLNDDAIVSEKGEILGYVSAFVGVASGSGDLANQLFSAKAKQDR